MNVHQLDYVTRAFAVIETPRTIFRFANTWYKAIVVRLDEDVYAWLIPNGKWKIGNLEKIDKAIDLYYKKIKVRGV